MIAKIQKQFLLTVGSNNTNLTEEDITKEAANLEQLGNHRLSARFHVEEIVEGKK